MQFADFKRGYLTFSAAKHGSGSEAIDAELCQPLEAQPMRLSQIRPAGEAPYAVWRAR